jgi:hypothetical protein
MLQCSAKHIAVVGVSTVGGAPTTGKKKGKETGKRGGDGTNSAIVSVWELPALLEGSCVPLAAQNARTSSFALLEEEALVGMECHRAAASVSLVTTTRWVKLAVDGTVLFERAIPAGAVYAVESSDQLCILGADRTLRFYDTRYGTELRSIALHDSSSSAPVSASWLVKYTGSDTTKANTGSAQLITCKLIKSAGPSNLYRRILNSTAAATQGSSLCNSIGKLATTDLGSERASLSAAGKRQLLALSAEAIELAAQNDTAGERKRRKSSVSASEQNCAVSSGGT